MAASLEIDAKEKKDKKLQDIFLEGWNVYEELEETTTTLNSTEFQGKVKQAMELFETVTRIVSEIGMFSPNEQIDEVSTECLQYLLLPLFLGKLALKRKDRLEVLNVSEVYFRDFLQRCQEYELCDLSSNEDATTAANGNSNELADLMRAAHTRNNKIATFRRKKELEEHIKKMKQAVKNSQVEDEIKREFFLNLLRKGIIDAKEELDSLQLEKQMVDMRKMYVSANQTVDDGSSTHSHGHSQSRHHIQQDHPKPKPLQPFIITRNATQKAVFGMGYPSLPILTVDEFYSQRVQDGIFPDEEKVAKMNQAQAIASAADPNEKEDDEQAVEEIQIENDDPEYLARMRRMDEYKDVVRRGDGNRHNRS